MTVIKLPQPANDTFQELREAGEAYGLECCTLEELVIHIIACGDERPLGFWTAAIKELVRLEAQYDPREAEREMWPNEDED